MCSIAGFTANIIFLFSAIEFGNVEVATNFTRLFPSQPEANITSAQVNRFEPNSLLVTTDTDVYSVSIKGNDRAKHIAGKHLLYNSINFENCNKDILIMVSNVYGKVFLPT